MLTNQPSGTVDLQGRQSSTRAWYYAGCVFELCALPVPNDAVCVVESTHAKHQSAAQELLSTVAALRADVSVGVREPCSSATLMCGCGVWCVMCVGLSVCLSDWLSSAACLSFMFRVRRCALAYQARRVWANQRLSNNSGCS